MSMLTRARSLGRHRGKTPAQLRSELDEATCHLIALTTENDELRAERNQLAGQLDTAQSDLADARHDLNTAGNERKRLEDALQAWESRWANAHPVHVPAPRDLRGSDERPTVPTDVSSIRAIYPVRPVYPISERPAAPDATNPANVPAA